MTALNGVKRVLREHPLSRHAYRVLAEAKTRFVISLHEITAGRYHNAEYFDRLFREVPDPWGYRKGTIAEERRARILDFVGAKRRHRLLEIGCAEGWITTKLANLSDEVVAVDISEVAIAKARQACGGLNNIAFDTLDLLSDALPPGSFDCVVCAGVLVFLKFEDQAGVQERILQSLTPGGVLLLEHTRDPYPGEIAGARIHELYRYHPQLRVLDHQEIENYAITVFEKKSLEA